MTVLEPIDKSRVRYHLAYTDAVPDGDRAILEDRMDNIADTYTVSRLRNRLDRCDRTLSESETDNQSSGIRSKYQIQGDVNRTNVEFAAEPLKARQKAYLYETDQLALELGVPNYRNPDWWGNRYMISSQGRIARIPAPVDTVLNLSIGSDLYLYYT
jgi:hypothetical protein